MGRKREGPETGYRRPTGPEPAKRPRAEELSWLSEWTKGIPSGQARRLGRGPSGRWFGRWTRTLDRGRSSGSRGRSTQRDRSGGSSCRAPAGQARKAESTASEMTRPRRTLPGRRSPQPASTRQTERQGSQRPDRESFYVRRCLGEVPRVMASGFRCECRTRRSAVARRSEDRLPRIRGDETSADAMRELGLDSGQLRHEAMKLAAFRLFRIEHRWSRPLGFPDKLPAVDGPVTKSPARDCGNGMPAHRGLRLRSF